MDKVLADRKSFIVNFVYFGIITGLYYFAVKYALGYVFPFMFAAILAIFLQTPIRLISKKFNIKTHGFVSTALVLLIVVLTVGILALFSAAAFNEIKDLLTHLIDRFESIDSIIETIRNSLMSVTAKLPEKMGVVINSKIDEFLLDLSSKGILKFDLSILSTPISSAWSIVKGLPSFAISVVVTIISCFFMTSEYDAIRDMILHFLPKEKGERLVRIKGVTTKGIGKLLKAYISIMFITFIETFVGLGLLKLIGVYDGGYIAIISLVVCIVDIVPVLGTGTVLIPWSLFYLLTGNIGLGIGLIILYIIITVLRQIIEPKFVAGQVGLPSIITIMAMFIGGRVLGIFGIIILPLTVIVIKLMYDEGIIDTKNSAELTSKENDK